MQNEISYSQWKAYKTYMWQDEHRTVSFGKQCKVHRNPNLSPNNIVGGENARFSDDRRKNSAEYARKRSMKRLTRTFR
jgi:hypothetical protein